MTLPRLRQVVLITADLEAALDDARQVLGLSGGLRDEEGMAALGLEHEVLAFRDSCVEILAPLSADSPQGARVARSGSSGYMVVVQVDDLAPVLRTADGAGLQSILQQDYHGHTITQWHPRDVGVLAEIDEVPATTWHMAPEVFERGSTEVARDIVGAVVATDDPEAMAARWGDLLGAPVEGGVTVRLGSETLRFVPGAGSRGLVAVELIATDPARVGEVLRLCGVDFHLLADASAGERS